MKRLMMLLAAAAIVASGSAHANAHSQGHGDAERVPVLREWNEDGTAAAGDDVVGRARLWRSEQGLVAKVKMRDLEPGGVYTFWWVVVQDDGTFPDDIHVHYGAGVIAGHNGNAKVFMTAQTGNSGIAGFPPLGGAEFADLNDPLGSLVRVEVAYHGQAVDAGGDLPVWLGDYWTGAACPPETPNPNPNQPHCPVYDAATFVP